MKYLVLLFFLLPFLPTEKVSTKCARQKLMADSMMNLEYGDYIAKNWFVFDEESYVFGDRTYLCRWNDRFKGDSITSYNLYYRFRFPGSKVSHIHVYSVKFYPDGSPDSTITRKPFASPSAKYITQEQLERLTKKHLRKKLADCFTTLWRNYWYPNANGDLIDLDSTHAYIEVHDYTRTGGYKRGQQFKVRDYKMLVDAYTGEFIGLDEHIYEGAVGSF